MTEDLVHLIEQLDGSYFYDSSDYSSNQSTLPKRVFFPKSHDECQRIMVWANLTNSSVVIRGAGTGTTGGAIPVQQDQVVLSLEKMTRLGKVDKKNATITVEPGVVLVDIHRSVEAVGLFYPPDPASLNKCTIGGNISENAGGPRALKYGVTRDYVIGLKGVWANGESFDYGGKIKKNVAGLDLIGLLIGSEGILGVVTEITLKLKPKPRYIAEAVVGYASSDDAVSALTNSLASGICPSTAEFMTQQCVDASLSYLKTTSMIDHHNAYVIWQVDGFTEKEVHEQLSQIKEMSQSSTFIKMDNQELSDHVWSIRRHVSLGLTKLAGKKYSEDIVVPVSNVPKVIKQLSELSHPCGIQVLGYGHLGDGNIHVNILKMSASDHDWERYSQDVISDVMDIAIMHGGSISGEHGIGLSKKQFMPLMFSDHDLSIMRNIKSIVDPNGILNPEKLLP